ncbi:HlyD family secretion protein [Desulforudis sp. DRI-14]|uniref:HlyD family secretion protein n=1 Tax=Desulforudis sp. DRI-14 TaxID=3459793 RepID=UPI00404207EB
MRVKKGKAIFGAVAVLMLVALGGVTFYYWYMNANYVITEDAYIDGTIIKVAPRISGELLDVSVEEGDRVAAGQVVARQDDVALAPGANPDLAVIRAPISGVVIKKLGNAGEVAAPGQSVIMLADPADVYVTANIEETKLAKVRPGKKVDLWVDGVPGRVFRGTVASIGEAANSTFSLLPTRTTGGSFTKVVQRVPVKILIKDAHGGDLRLGLNVKVRIHVR